MQAPTARQVKYKEKVQELRKKKDAGLSKDQKEKYMVWLLPSFVCLRTHAILCRVCCVHRAESDRDSSLGT